MPSIPSKTKAAGLALAFLICASSAAWSFYGRRVAPRAGGVVASGGAITFVSSATLGGSFSDTNGTFNINLTGMGSNGVLLVGVTLRTNNAATMIGGTVTDNGLQMRRSTCSLTNNGIQMSFWEIAGATAGIHTIIVTWAGTSGNYSIAAAGFSGVNQTNIGRSSMTFQDNANFLRTSSVTAPTTQTGDVCLDFISQNNGASSLAAFAPNIAQTELGDVIGNTEARAAMSYKACANGTSTSNWAWPDDAFSNHFVIALQQ